MQHSWIAVWIVERCLVVTETDANVPQSDSQLERASIVALLGQEAALPLRELKHARRVYRGFVRRTSDGVLFLVEP